MGGAVLPVRAHLGFARLYHELRQHLELVFRDLARRKECPIEEGHLLPDPVHMLIAIPPKYAVAQVMGFLKGKSAIHMARVWGGRKDQYVGQHFWARGYWVSTVGRDEAAVRACIAEQEKEAQRLDQLEMFEGARRFERFIIYMPPALPEVVDFDFRLEKDGVLKSWAVPKGVPTEPGIKRLAMQVDDHALEYGSFEGEIPAGQYGAGTVSIWDKGQYEAEEWTDKVISFTLHGARLDGRYALVRLSKGKATEWLLFKRGE